jgi:uncharacterized membrane protein
VVRASEALSDAGDSLCDDPVTEVPGPMSIYVILKIIHILAAITALGANLTYPFWLRRAGNDRDRVLDALDGIRRLDRTIANPAYIVVFVVGFLLVITGNLSFGTFWISASMGLFVIVAILGFTVYAPALRRQEAEARADVTSPAFAAAARRSNIIGIAVTLLVVVIVALMVAKPTL